MVGQGSRYSGCPLRAAFALSLAKIVYGMEPHGGGRAYWLQDDPLVSNIEIGPLVDTWYGP